MGSLAGEMVEKQRAAFWDRSVVIVAGLALIGLVDSLYLAYIKWTDQTAACAGIGDCEAVNNSSYAEVAGIPIALLGAMAFGMILALLLSELPWPGWSWTLRLGVFGIALAGTLYSAYLTYVELAILEAVCPFCVLSAVCMMGILVVSVLRLRAAEADA